MPFQRSYLYGSATGVWNVDWRDAVQHAGYRRNLRPVSSLAYLARHPELRVQAMLFAWAPGALLEGGGRLRRPDPARAGIRNPSHQQASEQADFPKGCVRCTAKRAPRPHLTSA